MDHVIWVQSMTHATRLHFDGNTAESQLDVLETLEKIESAVGAIYA
jgi:hypothetical protein